MTEQTHEAVRCPECDMDLAEHVGLQRGTENRYGGLHLALGMIPVRGQKRTYGPSPARKRGNRSPERLMVKRPGPVTLHCRRAGCEGVQKTVVAPATVL